MSDLPTIILASGSPRRVEVLRGLGIAFEQRPVDLDESVHDGEAAEAYVGRLAHEKAGALSTTLGTDTVVLAADTTVVLEDEILGKPVDAADARRMLERLSGRSHRVLTGIAVHLGDRRVGHVEETLVHFRTLAPAEIDWYLSTDEPWDKAGSYALQGLGALFIAGIEGSNTNVIGLPVHRVYDLFAQVDLDLRSYCGSESTPASPACR